MDYKEKALKITNILEEKKAKELVLINITDITILADYFVICTGTSSTHIKALSDELSYKMSEIGIKPLHIEGYETARWILMDFGEVVVHIFTQEDREFYNLERLWQDGKAIPV